MKDNNDATGTHGIISILPVNQAYIPRRIVIASNNQLASGITPNIPSANQNAGTVIGVSSNPLTVDGCCLSSTPLARIAKLVPAISMNENLLRSKIVISAGL